MTHTAAHVYMSSIDIDIDRAVKRRREMAEVALMEVQNGLLEVERLAKLKEVVGDEVFKAMYAVRQPQVVRAIPLQTARSVSVVPTATIVGRFGEAPAPRKASRSTDESVAQWLSYLCNHAQNDPTQKETPDTLFEAYTKWITMNNTEGVKCSYKDDFACTLQRVCKKNLPLHMKLHKTRWQINGVSYAKSGSKTTYNLDLPQIKSHLLRCGLFTEDH